MTVLQFAVLLKYDLGCRVSIEMKFRNVGSGRSVVVPQNKITN